MRLYVELARRSFQRHLAYRAATLAGLFTNAVFGVLIASVFTALYRERQSTAGGSVAGFTLPEMLTFVWIGQSLIMVVYLWGWWEVAAAIESGDIVADLMKPIDYYLYWFSRDLGRAACHALTRFVPTFLAGALVYDLAVPRSALTWGAFAVSVVLAVSVSFAWRFLLNLTSFWLLDVRGINALAVGLVTFFSGMLVPLPFFPDGLRRVAELLPFRAIVMLPVEVFLGHRAAGSALALQAAWAVGLALVGQGVLALAVRRMVVQGG